jgi:hypothetical protein
MTAPVGSNTRATAAPLILWAYFVFSLLASITAVAALISPSLSNALLPFTGFTGLAIYPFTVYFAFSALRTPRRRQVYKIAVLLALAMLFGFLDVYRQSAAPGGVPASNPSGAVVVATPNSLRPILTITLPALWLFLLISPGMKRWIRQE